MAEAAEFRAVIDLARRQALERRLRHGDSAYWRNVCQILADEHFQKLVERELSRGAPTWAEAVGRVSRDSAAKLRTFADPEVRDFEIDLLGTCAFLIAASPRAEGPGSADPGHPPP